MVDARTKRRRDAARSWRLGVAASLLAHLVFLAVLGVGLRRPADLPPSPAVEVELSPPWPTARLPERRPAPPAPAGLEKDEPAKTPPPSPAAAVPPGVAANAAPAPAAEPPPTAPPVAGGGGLASALRGSVGCDHADLVELSPAERQHCRDRFATAGKDPGDLTRFAIDPVKRAAFDAAWKADHSPQHMAALGCFMRFGGGKVEWLHPSEGFKLGRLPCYFVAPKATFSADPPPARGW